MFVLNKIDVGTNVLLLFILLLILMKPCFNAYGFRNVEDTLKSNMDTCSIKPSK